MPTFRKRLGSWRVEVSRHGIRRSATFASKTAAVAWAAQQEAQIMAGVRGDIPNLTVSALLTRYKEEVSARKKGARWEGVRLNALGRDRISSVPLRRLDAPHVADWQQRRLNVVSGASVRRERNLLNNVFQLAVKEWRWLKKNPFEGVRRPRDGKPRDRVATQDELDRLMGRASPQMRRVITFALETGMRCGEIASGFAVNGSIAYLSDSKGGARAVPLSAEALTCLPITMKASSISALFAQLTRECRITGLTFHDLRRTAITRLAKKLDPFELAKMVGHKDLKMTLNTYYKADLNEIARKLG